MKWAADLVSIVKIVSHNLAFSMSSPIANVLRLHPSSIIERIKISDGFDSVMTIEEIHTSIHLATQDTQYDRAGRSS